MAVDFANAMNPISNKYKIEIGANFYYDNKSNNYMMGDVFTDLNSTGVSYDTYDVDLSINGGLGSHVASIHTHGTYGTNDHIFSVGDYNFTNTEYRVPLYMSSSNLQVISPGFREPRLVTSNINQ